MPDQWAANTFMALQGPQTTSWLNDRSSGFINPKEALKQGQLSTNVIQGINRICTRKTIDDAGNCPPAEGYILMPYGEAADCLIKDITNSMPGLSVKRWNTSEALDDPEDMPDMDIELEGMPWGGGAHLDLKRTLLMDLPLTD